MAWFKKNKPPQLPGADEMPTMRAADGLANLVTGMGVSGVDKSLGLQYYKGVKITRDEIESAHEEDWLAKRIISTPVDDMIRNWFTCSWDATDDSDEHYAIEGEEERLNVKAKVREGLELARMFGGAIMVMGIDGEETAEAMGEPLDIARLGKGSLKWLRVFDRWQLYGMPPNIATSLPTITKDNLQLVVPYLSQSIGDPNFGRPEHYYLAESGLKIHHSRVCRFDGMRLSWRSYLRNMMWHDSVFQSVLRAVKGYSSVIHSLVKILDESTLKVVSAQGLAKLLSTREGETMAANRYHALNFMMSIHKMMILDKDQEEYHQHVNPLTGLGDLVDRFMNDVCGAADIPATRLFGRSPAGMNATGESDLQNYDDFIRSRQIVDMYPPVSQLYRVMGVSSTGHELKDFRLTFAPLRQTTPSQQADVDDKRAKVDKVYFDMGVLSGKRIATELKERGTYITIEDEDIDAAEDMDEMALERAERMDEQVTAGGEVEEEAPVKAPKKAAPKKKAKKD